MRCGAERAVMFARKNLLRPRGGHDHARVTYVELFFDLVFVFAWITNWLDPEQRAVRLMLFVLMAAGLVMSASIPEAFGARGMVFALAYVFMQVGRSVFMLWAVKRHDHGTFRTFQRITAWFAAAGVFWIAGGLTDGWHRVALWALAIGIEYVSPAVGMWVPRLGRSTPQEWRIDGGHLAERCALFVIIALGESLLVTGATFAEMAWSQPAIAAFVAAFLGSVAMWALYFNVGAERGSHHIASVADPRRLGRNGYTYLHMLIVTGIIVSAVADELALAHPDGHSDPKTALVMVGGPAIYLLGIALFKKLTAPYFPLSHLVGLGLLALLAGAYSVATPLQLAAATTAILLVVAIWEWASLTDRGQPPPAHGH
jgi:low temperature requirement protein LtrA